MHTPVGISRDAIAVEYQNAWDNVGEENRQSIVMSPEHRLSWARHGGNISRRLNGVE